MPSRRHRIRALLRRLAGAGMLAALLSAGALADGSTAPEQAGDPEAGDGSDLLIVDCLLPGKIRRLGRKQTYVTRRSPRKLSARECEIRGGEYTTYDRADLRTSLSVWLDQAKAGDPEAETYVGEIFEKGMGVPPDYETAAQWYERAAQRGFARAQMNLGHLYEKGLGVERDPMRALELFRSAVGLPGAFALEQTVARSAAEQTAEELARTQSELDALRVQLEQSRSERESLSEQIKKARARAKTTGPRDQIERDKQKIEALERTLMAKQAALEELESELGEVRGQLQKAEAAPAPEPEPAPADHPPPLIEIIDPALKKTRGVRLVELSGETRELLGRVTAPAGLFSFLVDGQKVEVSDAGLFSTTVALTDSPRIVRLIAMDHAGKSSNLELELARAKKKKEPKFKPLRRGRYVALIVGNNGYEHLVDLDSAARDAQALDKTLREKFDFETHLLLDASRYQILSALNDLRQNLTEKDSLLIYYAGHGELDDAIQRGYWLPVDAERANPANWISTTTITDILSALSAKHVMVIADSCYAGALTRSALARVESGMSEQARQRWLEALAEKRSRTALSSGGLQPVLDAGAGGHSVFAGALLKVLNSAEDVIEGRRLYLELAAAVTDSAARAGGDQVPEYAPIKFAGHEGGDFFFVPR